MRGNSGDIERCRETTPLTSLKGEEEFLNSGGLGNEVPLPDLIVVDGGKGQLSTVKVN
jgi:excinuclease UvrABC nuclease subunit